MRMRNEIVVRATPQRIYERAAATERWPQILPHYRFVRVLSGDAEVRTVEMAASAPFEKLGFTIPVRWRAQQVNDSLTPRISFRHVRGWTKGMLVHWEFETDGEQTLVTIHHELRSPLAPIIGKFFIDPIATRTLQCIKALAEADR